MQFFNASYNQKLEFREAIGHCPVQKEWNKIKRCIPKGSRLFVETTSDNKNWQNYFPALDEWESPREFSIWLKIIIAGIKSNWSPSAQFIFHFLLLPYAWHCGARVLWFWSVVLCKYLEMGVLADWQSWWRKCAHKPVPHVRDRDSVWGVRPQGMHDTEGPFPRSPAEEGCDSAPWHDCAFQKSTRWPGSWLANAMSLTNCCILLLDWFFLEHLTQKP